LAGISNSHTTYFRMKKSITYPHYENRPYLEIPLYSYDQYLEYCKDMEEKEEEGKESASTVIIIDLVDPECYKKKQ